MKKPLEKPNKREKPLFICVCSQWIFGEIVTRDVTRTSVLAFVSSVRSPLTSSSLLCTVLYRPNTAQRGPVADCALCYTARTPLSTGRWQTVHCAIPPEHRSARAGGRLCTVLYRPNTAQRGPVAHCAIPPEHRSARAGGTLCYNARTPLSAGQWHTVLTSEHRSARASGTLCYNAQTLFSSRMLSNLNWRSCFVLYFRTLLHRWVIRIHNLNLFSPRYDSFSSFILLTIRRAVSDR